MIRYLTNKEIEYIIDFVKINPYIPLDSANSIVKINKTRLRNQLINQKVYPEIIPELKKQLKKQYNDSIVEPGESVGVICAQSIGEKQTQSTLNTFHKAGQSEKVTTTGVPRFQELINATKDLKLKSCKLFFNKNITSIQQLRSLIGHSIVGLTFKDIILSSEIKMNKKDEVWYTPFKILYNNNFISYPNCISYKININKLYEYKLNIEDIVNILESEYDDIYCVHSPPTIGILDIFINTNDITLPSDRVLFIDTDNASQIYLEECVIPTLDDILICGIDKIKGIYYSKKDNEWVAETDGSNLKELLAHPNIDMSRIYSNNVWDIYDILGIEAARQYLLEEFMEIMEGINICHTKLLVERMTHIGTICSISRYTMRKEKSGVLTKASFEETMSNFVDAAATGIIESTENVSASVICGKRANIGTGMIDLRIDLNKLNLNLS